MSVPGWMDAAACAGEGRPDHDPWFPEGQGATTGEAKAVCRSCPVAGPCLDYALQHRLRDGIFGGMTPGERQAEALRRRDVDRAA